MKRRASYELRSRSSDAKSPARQCMFSKNDAEKVIKRLRLNRPNREQQEKLCSYLQEELATARCLSGWKVNKLLGIGTIGTVIGVCNRGQVCAAVKISEIKSEKDRQDVQREVRLQQKAAPYAPRIYEFCMFETSNGQKWAAIVMETISGEVDEFLTVRRSDAVIIDLATQVRRAVEGLCKKGMSHGDLVYFNIGYKRTASGRMKYKLIDFDRATDDFCDLRVDLSRLILELYPQNAAPNQKPIEKSNAQRLRTLFLKWAQSIGVPQFERLKTGNGAETYWERSYESYCKRAKVKCL